MQPLGPQGYGTSHPYSQQAQLPLQATRLEGDGSVTERTAQLLHQTRPWVLFLSVLMFVGSAFLVLGGLAMFAMGAAGGAMGSREGATFGALGLLYLPVVALYVYPALKLWGYGSAIGRLVSSRAVGDLEAALSEQKSFWKFLGIMTLVVFALYAVAFVGIALLGVAAVTSVPR